MVRAGIIVSNKHEKNGVVKQKRQLNYIDEKYTVH